jgi:glycosyltransferase involved in cell wall biosynthesis
MIVMHVAEYASGGVATYLKNLIDEQSKNSNISKIYLLCSSKKSDLDLLRFKSKKVEIIGYEYNRNLLGIFKLLMLAPSIKKKRVDIIHLHSTFAGLLRVTLALNGCRKKVIYCSHGWAFNKKTSPFNKYIYELIEKVLSGLCNKIINISDSEADSAKFISSKRMITIKNSIPDIKFTGQNTFDDKKSRRMLFIGRLDKQKGIDLLIKAVNNVNKHTDRKIHLDVVGDSVLEDSVIEKNNTKEISFLGWQTPTDTQKILLENEALIIPSRWEGFGLTALEAMRARRMVLASDAGALPEIIQDNYTGLVFKKNSVEALEKVLKEFLNLTHDELKKFGEHGRDKYIREFSYAHLMEQMNKLYYEVAKGE